MVCARSIEPLTMVYKSIYNWGRAPPCGKSHQTYWGVSRREWMGMGVAGIVINGYEMDHSLIPCVKRTSKIA